MSAPHLLPGVRRAAGEVRSKRLASTCPTPPFRIVAIATCQFGKKRAEGTIEIDGLGQIDFELYVPDGRPAFVTSRSVLSKYGGKYERTARLTDEFAAEICEATEARLAAEHDG